MTDPVRALLFDKDGTLFDFGATWNGWAAQVLRRLAEGDPAREAEMAAAWRFDLAKGAFLPDSPVIAGTEAEAAAILARCLPGSDARALCRVLGAEAAAATPVPATPLAPLLDGFRTSGLHLGVVTNDSEAAARAQLRTAGTEAAFDFIAGYDSGHGAKPDPGPLLAGSLHLDVPPEHCVMVGDSTHDLLAAQAAGMRGVGVLTGLADEAALAPHATVVLPHIGHLPDWLGLGVSR